MSQSTKRDVCHMSITLDFGWDQGRGKTWSLRRLGAELGNRM